MSNVQMREINRFKSRLILMDALAQKWHDRFNKPDRRKVLGNETLANMLEAFRLFAWEYFVFLAGGESENVAYDLNKVLGNLQEEWKVLSYVCEQRSNEHIQTELEVANKEAQVLYERFRGYKPNSSPPIIYFDRLFAIRRYAFTPFPLISIPLHIYHERDYLRGGIAHELSHFIYHNSVPLDNYRGLHKQLQSKVLEVLTKPTNDFDLFQKQAKIADIWLSWLEETFADICGTLLVGPAYATSGQQLILETTSTANERSEDDGAHPAPYLRPFIAIETLAWVQAHLEATDNRAQKLQVVIDKLKENWEDIRRQGRRQAHQIDGVSSGVKMWEIEDRLQDVVLAILGQDGAGSWLNAAGEFADLGTLFDTNIWLDSPDASLEAAVAGDDDQALKAPENLELFQESSSFSKLQQFLEKKHGASSRDKKVREALLDLELGTEDFARCFTRRVKWVGYGNGYYAKCNT